MPGGSRSSRSMARQTPAAMETMMLISAGQPMPAAIIEDSAFCPKTALLEAANCTRANMNP